MLISKFGENQFWCPDCYNEKKAQKMRPAVEKQGEGELMDALRKIYEKLNEIDNNFKAFTKIFGEKDD